MIKTLLVCIAAMAFSMAAFGAKPTATPVENKVSFTGEYVLLEDATIAPKAIKQDGPAYPAKMRQASIEGAVQIAYIVNAKGRTEEVQVVKATDASFGEACVEAVSKWRFKPGKKDGKAVRVLVVQSMHFTISP